MAASVSIQKTIYVGSFAHSVGHAELEVCARGAIGVDEEGVIQFVDKDVGDEEDADVSGGREGWNGARIVGVRDGFFFPGFIGE